MPTPTATATSAIPGSIPLPAAPAYGNIPGGDHTHVNEVIYTFTADSVVPKTLQFHFDAYDVDWAGEVAVYLNGHIVKVVPPTGNNQWQSYTAKLPAFRVKAGQVNQIVVSDTANPPNSVIWGVRNAFLTKTEIPTPTVTTAPTATATPSGDIPLPANDAYGNIPGGDQTHIDQVVYTFTLPNGLARIDRTLDVWQFHFNAYDVDWAGEVALYLNGHLFYIVPPTGNNQWASHDVTLPGAFLTKYTNRIVVSDTANPPGRAIWGVRKAFVTKFGAPTPTPTATPLTESIPLPADAAYGNIPGGDQTHIDQVVYTFTGQLAATSFSFSAYDVDWAGEVALYLNGHLFYVVPPTGNNQWAAYSVNLPRTHLLVGQTNRLVVSDTANPPNRIIWGVREAKIGAGVIPLPAMAAYGNIPGGDRTHINQVDYSFDGITGPVMLTFQAYDVDWAGEVLVRLNNRLIYVVPVRSSSLKRIAGIERNAAEHLAPQENNAWTTYVVRLQDEWVNDQSSNKLVFDDSANPPGQAIWGVRGVVVSKIVAP